MIEVFIIGGLSILGLAIFTALCLYLERKYEEKVEEPVSYTHLTLPTKA